MPLISELEVKEADPGILVLINIIIIPSGLGSQASR